MTKKYTIKEITQALEELESDGKAERLNAGKWKNKKFKCSGKPIKVKAANRLGRSSILDGLAVGETRDLFGNSKVKVFSAIARRGRTHCCEKYACHPVMGAFSVTRIR